MALLRHLGRLARAFRRGGAPDGAVPERATAAYPRFVQLGETRSRLLPALKPTPLSLRYFSRTPYARRAINAIKNPVAQLAWEVAPRRGAEASPELQHQIAVATRCLGEPNAEDSFRSLIEQVLEDALCGGGAIEVELGQDPERPLWLWPVDGLSIQIYPGWSGTLGEARYLQTLGYGGIGATDQGVALLDEELIYIRPNPSTATPFGVGPLEIAFTSVSRLLGVAEYAGNLSSNTRPATILDLGEAASPDELAAFRAWWRNDIEGQGMMPIVGGMQKPQVLRLAPEGDEALYLKYQEFLKAEIAAAFDLSPQNLGKEANVNRSTAEVAEDRDWDQAIKPWAGLIAAHLTQGAIAKRLGFSQLEFRFTGIDREDERETAEIFQIYYRNNALTPNEQRARLGLPRLASRVGDMTAAEAALMLARAGVRLPAARAHPAQPSGEKEDDHGS